MEKLIFETKLISQTQPELTFTHFKQELLDHCGKNLQKFNFSDEELESFLLLTYLLGDIVSEHVLHPSFHE